MEGGNEVDRPNAALPEERSSTTTTGYKRKMPKKTKKLSHKRKNSTTTIDDIQAYAAERAAAERGKIPSAWVQARYT